MIVTHLAAENVAELSGRLTVLFGLPAVGVLLLAIGFWERSRKRSRQAVGYLAPGFPPGGAYPHPPGPYPGYPHRPPAGPPRRDGSTATALISIGAVMLALGALAFVGQLAHVASEAKTSRPSSPSTGPPMPAFRPITSLEVGQCIDQFSLGTRMLSAGPGDCADVTSTYEVAAKGDGNAKCPDGQREGSVYDVLTDKGATLCLVLNLKQGQCYLRMEDRSSHQLLSPVDCDDVRYAQVRVAQRVDGSTGTARCPDGATLISYPYPARLYCMTPVGSQPPG